MNSQHVAARSLLVSQLKENHVSVSVMNDSFPRKVLQLSVLLPSFSSLSTISPFLPHITSQCTAQHCTALPDPHIAKGSNRAKCSRTWLYCNVLYYTILYCNIIYCTVLYRAVTFCTVLYCNVRYCTVLCCDVLCYTVLC